MHHDDPPDEIKAYACDVRDLLGLGEWDITIKMVDAIPDEADESECTSPHVIGGDTTYEEPYRIATIRLVRGFEPERWREHVMHEMLHLAIAPLAHAARHSVMGLIPSRLHVHAMALIGDGEERAVTALAKALVKSVRPSSTGAPS